MTIANLSCFLQQQRLPPDYRHLVAHWFQPLSQALSDKQRHHARPILVGINGCQGSGKSTLAALLRHLLEQEAGLKTINLSLDDFYLSRAGRQGLAKTIHPLLATRGVPGTHDTILMTETLQSLLAGRNGVAIPRFDKGLDEPKPRSQWVNCSQPDVVIWEGWCLGVTAESQADLETPINLLEAKEDPDGRWRHHVNRCLTEDYAPLFDKVDTWIMLCAPSFDCVIEWRQEQEEKLLQACQSKNLDTQAFMNRDALVRFIQHYQRLTKSALAQLPARVDHLYLLDAQRDIRGYSGPIKTQALEETLNKLP